MATKRTITKKAIPQKSVAVPEQKTVEKEQRDTVFLEEQTESTPSLSDGAYKRERTKRECFFCKSKSTPSYTDLANLRRFLTDRAKIVGKERSGVCSKHQRGVTKNIKYARHLALLPFVPKV